MKNLINSALAVSLVAMSSSVLAQPCQTAGGCVTPVPVF